MENQENQRAELKPLKTECLPMSADAYKTLLGILPKRRGNLSGLTKEHLKLLESRLIFALNLVLEKDIFGDD